MADLSSKNPNYETSNDIDVAVEDVCFTPENNAVIGACIQLYGEEPLKKGSDKFNAKHANKLLNSLTFVATLTNNSLLQVALCIDHQTIQKYDGPKKKWKLPACHVTGKNTLQGTLTDFARERYNKWIPLQIAILIKAQEDKVDGESEGAQNNIALVNTGINALNYPQWNGKTNMQNDYGCAQRHMQHYWYLHPELTRQQAFTNGITELKEQCQSREGPREIIAGHLNRLRTEHCDRELLKSLEETKTQTHMGKNEKVVVDNDLLAERLEAFFTLHKIEYIKKNVPDPLILFKAYLGLEATSFAIKNKFRKFRRLSPVRSEEYDLWVIQTVAKENKQEDAVKKKAVAEDNKRKSKTEADSRKKAKLKEQELRIRQKEEQTKSIRKQIGLPELSVEPTDKGKTLSSTGECNDKTPFVKGKRPRMNGYLSVRETGDVRLDPPLMVFLNHNETDWQMNEDGAAIFKEPGVLWETSMTMSYRHVFTVMDYMIMELKMPIEAFAVEDEAMQGNLCDYSAMVIAALWNVNMKTATPIEAHRGYDFPLFLQYADESHASWLHELYHDRVQPLFAAFFAFVIGTHEDDPDNELLEKVCKAVLKVLPHAEERDHLFLIMMELFKVNSYVRGDSLAWADTNTLEGEEAIPDVLLVAAGIKKGEEADGAAGKKKGDESVRVTFELEEGGD
jgi:hypothetical protein